MFRRVAIVGVGLIGGSLGMALQQRNLAQTVVGVEPKVETLETAKRLGAIDTAETDLIAGVAGCDLVVLATPIAQILADIERLPGSLADDAVVTDVGSVKGDIVAHGKRFLGGRFSGSHPMAGSEKSGVEHARANLFEGATWATLIDSGFIRSLRRVTHLAKAVGAEPSVTTAEAHDKAVALTSHLPHVLAYALSAQGVQTEEGRYAVRHFAAGSWASATRVAHSNPKLWQGIALANRPALLNALGAYIEELQATRAALASGDADVVPAAFERGDLPAQND